MFALSHDSKRLFFYQPDMGFVVPVTCELATRRLAIEVPSVDALSDDYAVYDSFEQLRAALPASLHEVSTSLRKLSEELSGRFRERIRDDMRVLDLRELVKGHLPRALASDSEQVGKGHLFRSIQTRASNAADTSRNARRREPH